MNRLNTSRYGQNQYMHKIYYVYSQMDFQSVRCFLHCDVSPISLLVWMYYRIAADSGL